MDDTWRDYVRLCSIPDIGAVTAMRLIRHFGSASAALRASESELKSVERIGEKTARTIVETREEINLEKVERAMDSVGARYIPYTDSEYPSLLEKISDKPVGLYKMGNADLNAPCIAIVGSRSCSTYGRLTARNFAAAFARAGFTVVSGMARGIDSAAHEGAIDAGGRTIAVLGCGADVVYPPENTQLYRKLCECGAIISEFPMGTRADRQNFPIRNRIISGMSLATLVVESDLRGGSMITARTAAEQGRDVFAIPGRIGDNSSRGCNALIRDGVTLASSPEDIIDSLKFSGQIEFSFQGKNRKHGLEIPPGKAAPKPIISFSEDEDKILRILSDNSETCIDEISERSGFPVQKCIPILLKLEIKKAVSHLAGGNWLRK